MQALPITPDSAAQPADDRINWIGCIPFLGVHLACLGVFFVGVTWKDVALCLGLYYLRMFAITAGYHRYFSHRTYKTGRVFQFLLALLGTTSLQKGPLWWAAHHRRHHRYSDTEQDIHSPMRRGFWYSHMVWTMVRRWEYTDWERIKDFAKFPELRFLNRFHLIAPLSVATLQYYLGGWHALMWGGFISSTLLWHGTFTINSLSHVFGRRRYPTSDTSKNNFWLALVTMGEGWHNNHHYYQGSANQGFFWWEIDMSYYLLKVLSWFGIVWDLRKPPQRVLNWNATDEMNRNPRSYAAAP